MSQIPKLECIFYFVEEILYKIFPQFICDCKWVFYKIKKKLVYRSIFINILGYREKKLWKIWVCEDYIDKIEMWGKGWDTRWSKRTHNSGFRSEDEWQILDKAKGMMAQGGDTKSEETWNVLELNSYTCFCPL